MSKVSFNPLTINSLTLMKGLQELIQTQKRGSIGEEIEDLFKAEDSTVDTIVAHKDEIAKPETRTEAKEVVESLKKDMKEELGGLTDKDVPKTVSQFYGMVVAAMTAGMFVGNVKAALALIPEAGLTTETTANGSGSKVSNEVSDNDQAIRENTPTVDEAFSEADSMVNSVLENKTDLTKPSKRQETINELDFIKKGVKAGLSLMTEKTLPKNIKEALSAFMAAFTFGTLTGVTKTALGLIPVESTEQKPELPEPVICPK